MDASKVQEKILFFFLTSIFKSLRLSQTILNNDLSFFLSS